MARWVREIKQECGVLGTEEKGFFLKKEVVNCVDTDKLGKIRTGDVIDVLAQRSCATVVDIVGCRPDPPSGQRS